MSESRQPDRRAQPVRRVEPETPQLGPTLWVEDTSPLEGGCFVLDRTSRSVSNEKRQSK